MLIEIISHPNSRQEKIIEINSGKFEIWIKQPAVENKANKEIINLLSDYLNVNKSRIRLVRGKTSRHKLFDIITLE